MYYIHMYNWYIGANTSNRHTDTSISLASRQYTQGKLISYTHVDFFYRTKQNKGKQKEN